MSRCEAGVLLMVGRLLWKLGAAVSRPMRSHPQLYACVRPCVLCAATTPRAHSPFRCEPEAGAIECAFACDADLSFKRQVIGARQNGLS